MAGIYIILCIFLIFLFILTERVEVKINKDVTFSFEIHFVFLALCFKKRARDRKKNGLPPSFYARLVSRLSSLARVSKIEIKQITLPTDTENFDRTTLTRPYRYHSAASAAIAYLTAKAKKLTIKDNAITLAPDSNIPFGFELVVRTSLFNLLRAASPLLFHIFKNKKRRKEKENVGN